MRSFNQFFICVIYQLIHLSSQVFILSFKFSYILLINSQLSIGIWLIILTSSLCLPQPISQPIILLIFASKKLTKSFNLSLTLLQFWLQIKYFSITLCYEFSFVEKLFILSSHCTNFSFIISNFVGYFKLISAN